MSVEKPFRILIIEDIADWLGLIEEACQKQPSIGVVDTARDQRKATELLSLNHFHYVSIDQNIPDRLGETVGANYGLEFCERLVQERPFTDRSIYTAHGQIGYANRIGSLDGTPYVEKRSSEDALDPKVNYLDVDEYASWIGKRLVEGHHFWVLERSIKVLPPSLGEPAQELGRAWKQQEWAKALDQLGSLWERSLELAWAQTRAVAAHLHIPVASSAPASAFVPRAKEDELANLWPTIAARGLLDQWRKYIGVGNRSTGQGAGRVFIDVSARLRSLRNSRAHGDIAHPGENDVAGKYSEILRLIDALAFWGEVPLITGPRHHPSERGKIQFVRLSGSPPWPVSDFEIDVSHLSQRPDRVYSLWGAGDEVELIDLFPFVIMERGEAGRSEPHVLVSPLGARPRFRSLVSGRATDDRADWKPAKTLTDALADLFTLGRAPR
jgi:hypothetical protein